MTDNEKKANIENDIKEREELISQYKSKGFFTEAERKDAINKIKLLRATDINVDLVTVVEQRKHSTPFDVAPDGSIAAELQMQINILSAELLT